MFYPVTYKQMPTGHPHLCFKLVESRPDLVPKLREKFNKRLRAQYISLGKRKGTCTVLGACRKAPKTQVFGRHNRNENMM